MEKNSETQDAAHDWLMLENDSDEPLDVFIEPYAIDCAIPPKTYFDVYLPTVNGERPKITYTSDKMIILWANYFAIFHDGVEIWDFSGIEGLRPPDPLEESR